MRPTGWFQIGWSADRQSAMSCRCTTSAGIWSPFAASAGGVSVLDAHCQHLGANLAFGGCVVEDGIQCPFHGWVWNGNGRNVRIPYEKRPNKGRRVRSYPVAELTNRSTSGTTRPAGSRCGSCPTRSQSWVLTSSYAPITRSLPTAARGSTKSRCIPRCRRERRRSAPLPLRASHRGEPHRAAGNTATTPPGRRKSASAGVGPTAWTVPTTP